MTTTRSKRPTRAGTDSQGKRFRKRSTRVKDSSAVAGIVAAGFEVRMNKKNTILPLKDQKSKTWNDMSHLSIKRFKDGDPSLSPGAIRNRESLPYVAIAEIDPSGRSICKLCGSLISKGSLRLGLMMECHKGYRNLCTLHTDCFWIHPETLKLESFDEIFLRPSVTDEHTKELKLQFLDS